MIKNYIFMLRIRLYLMLLLIFFVISSGFSQGNSKEFKSLKTELSDYIEKEMKSYNVVGLSIALVDDQDVIWSKGFGYADKANDLDASPKTIYRVGSVSKLFTSLAIMQLVEKNLLNIDDPINKYIPEFSIKTRFVGMGDITPRNVMTHHAGLPSDIYNGFFSEDPKPFTSIIGYLNNEYTCSPPNFCFSYSNPGYSLLGCLVERVSGKSFIDYTKKYIFRPMGMKNSSFELTPEMEDLYAKGYLKGIEYNEPGLRDLPAAFLHTNVLDLANFIKMTFNNGVSNENQVVLAETLKEMQSQQNKNTPLDMGLKMGLCWFLSDTDEDWDYAGGIAEHGGDTYVYHASLMVLPKQKIGVVVLTNSDSGNKIAGNIARMVLKRTLEVNKGIFPPVIKENNLNKEKIHYIKAKKKFLTQYQGDYLVGTTAINVIAKRNKLISNLNGIKVILRMSDKGTFIPRIKLFGFIPLTQKRQKIKFSEIEGVNSVLLFSNNNKDSSIAGIKINKNEITDIWKKRIGKYIILNDDSDYKMVNDIEILFNNGFLTLKGKDFAGGTLRMLINPISDNEAIVEGIGRSTGYTLTFNDSRMYFSGLKLKKIKE
jgi:CubicO group peptidase (beta-lactamase class C family)